MSDNGTPTVDLSSKFGPIRIDAGPAGPIIVPIRTAGFLSWFERNERKQPWADGPSFVRAMLAEQARSPVAAGEAVALDPNLIAGLDAEALDAIGAAMLDAIGPTLIRDGRRDHDGDEAKRDGRESENRAGEPASSQLLTMVRAYYEHHRAAMKTLADRLLKDVSLSTIRRALGATAKLQLGSDHFRSLVTPADPVSRFLAEQRLSNPFQGLASTHFLEQQKLIADRIAAITRPIETLRSTTTLTERFKPMISPVLREEIIGSPTAWAMAVNAGLDLRIPSRLFADMTKIHSATAGAAEAVAKIMAQTRLDCFGFQATANLALDGLVAPGAAADLLQRYGEDSALHGATFDTVLDAIRSLDEEELDVDPEAAAERAWHQILSQLSGKVPHMDAAAWLSLAALLFTVVGVLIEAASYVEQRRSDPSRALKAIERELGEIRADRLAEKAADRQTDRFLRYVHGTVNLRAEPSRSGMVIRLVYPDQLVRVIETKGDWAMVDVFDYASETPMRGWINRRNLRVRPPS